MTEIVVTFLIESLTTKLQNEVRLLRNIRPQVQSITEELDRIKSFLRAAEEKEDSHSNKGLGVSLKQLRGVAHDIEDSVDEFYLRFSDHEAIGFRSGSVSWWIGKPFRLIKNLKARRRITLDIGEAVTRVRSIVDGMQWFINAQVLVPRSSDGDDSSGKRIESRSDALLLEEADLVGIGENRKAMIEWLLNRDNDSGRRVISVAGTAGLGKTTLVRKVYEDPRVKKRFKVHAWVTVTRSEKSNKDLLRDLLREVFRVIGKPVPAEMNDYDMDELRENIKNLLMLSRYLIILDDVWGTSAWDLIKLSLPKSKKFGSKVVITTRSFDVAHHACAERRDWVFELKPLEEKESWELFCRKAFCRTTNGTCPEHLEGLCRCVLRSCDGLPLAIVTIGAVLGAKDEKEREEKLAGMCQNVGPEMDDNSRPLDSMMRVLALSFNDLPYYLKACFLYLSLFPAKLGMERMRLIRLWIAEDFIPEREGKSLEEVAEGYFKELLDRSLVHVAETTTDGRIKSCKTHELLRTLAISKAKEQDFAEIARDKDDKWSDKPRRLSVCSTSQNGGNGRVSKLRTLLVFMVEEEKEEEEEDSRPEFSLSALFPGRNFRLLKILDLRGLPIKRFPRETVNLYHLRYLSLRETSVDHIPSWIKKLQNLETLDLKQTKVSKLPLEVLTLRKLRHLLIYNYKIRSYVHFNKKTGVKAPQGIGNNLRSLQKLCFVEANQEIVREVGEMSQLRRLGIMKLIREDGAVLCSSIEKLVKLRSLSITSVDKDTIIDVSHVAHAPESLQRIYLNGRLEKMPLWIKSLRNLVVLFLKWSRLKEDPLVHLQDLPNLVHLEFLKVFEGESLHFKEGGFPKLKLLGLDKLKQLKSMTIDIGVMPFLEKLVIQRCKELKNVPVGIEHLRNLKVIEFFDMPDELVMKLRPDGGEDYSKVDHVPAVYSSYWSKDGWDGWDVYSVDRFMEKDNSHRGNTNTATRNQPCALWKV